ncbi:MAG: hypothetical protein NZ942_02415 [Candidatus Aenigmarchaeota archaeon]|nr:hypothetical protein [Candidatus Aenigmarchaeota archaeon]
MKSIKKILVYREKFSEIAFYSICGGALFVQNLLFYDIATKGRFIATESNPYILGAEIGLTILGDYLFVKHYLKFIKKMKMKND